MTLDEIIEEYDRLIEDYKALESSIGRDIRVLLWLGLFSAITATLAIAWRLST